MTAVDELYAEALRLTSVDLTRAAEAARKTDRAARKNGGARERGFAERILGHVAFYRSRHRLAVRHYEASVGLFDAAGLAFESAITRSGALGALIYLAEYDRVTEWAAQARGEFEARQDLVRLARLDGNLALAAFRQDRFEEAYRLYESAHREFEQSGRVSDIANVLWNKATCLISMGDFQKAAHAHREARAYAEQHGLPMQLAAIDYNAAYLHYLCGDYTDAMRLFDIARRTGQPYRRALCDLDEAEMYLELNLHREAEDLAKSAAAQFQRLGMPYELGKAAAFLAIARGQQGNLRQALRGIARSRRTFQRERNDVWLAMLDLYQAILLDRAGESTKALRLAGRARDFFSGSALPAKSVTAELLAARLDLRRGHLLSAERRCEDAYSTPAVAESASLRYQAAQLRAEILEAMGRHAEARIAYENALECLEMLRFRLRGDEIKIAFLADKLSVYDNLFWLTLSGDSPTRVTDAFRVAEMAKSRSMAEQPGGPRATQEPAALSEMRRDLDVLYQQIQREESRGGAPAGTAGLRAAAARQEAALAGRLAALNALRGTGAGPSGLGASELREWLPEGTQLAEYFVSRETLFVFLAGRNGLRVWPLAPVRRVAKLVRLLRFHLAGPGGDPGIIRAHLRQLHDEILGPLRPSLDGEHLVVIPHGVLHGLPFAALHDGSEYLTDRFTISYAPSARLLHLTGNRPAGRGEGVLIASASDEQAPEIETEARRLHQLLGGSRLLSGAEANAERLRQEMPGARIVHIAAHGYFQRDNPLFSAIRLHGSWLTVFDLYRFDLKADLVTLSGCSTGLAEVVGADELVGLVRGLLQAGARSALLSLWDVHDQSTAEFMEIFYRHHSAGVPGARAARLAGLALRDRYPEVFHWAPFCFVGLGQ